MKEAMQANLGRAFRYARHVLGDAGRAEDAVQEACLRVFSRPAPRMDAAAARAYFLKAVRNAALNLAESDAARARREEAVMTMRAGTAASPDRAAAERELGLAARRELERLPREQREAIALCCQEGLSQEEAGDILGVPRTTVSGWLGRGLDELRRALSARGFAAAAPAAIAAGLSSVSEEAPAALVARIQAILESRAAAGTAGAPGAATSAAVKGGLIVKIGLGVAAAGLVAGGIFWAVGGKSEEPAKTPSAAAPEKKSKFDIPVWHPDAEWELAGPFIAPPKGAHGIADLDGPAREMLYKNGRMGIWGYVSHYDPCLFSCYDAASDRYHAVAGSARGHLDGPFSRARYGGSDYGARSVSTQKSESGNIDLAKPPRYVFLTDPYFGAKLRCLDFVKQEIRTVKWEGRDATFGFTISKTGQLYVLSPPNRLLIINAADGKLVKQMTVELQDTGLPLGWPHSLALDEKHNRLYASGQYNPPRKWHIWYWDLNANGAFHGEVATSNKAGGGPVGGAPGSYKDGWSVYPEGWISFGPDDPDYHFLYTSRTDLGNGYRLDLEKKEVWILNGPAKAGGGSKFEFAGMRGLPVATPHCAPFWLANGDFVISAGGSGSWGLFMFKRVK